MNNIFVVSGHKEKKVLEPMAYDFSILTAEEFLKDDQEKDHRYKIFNLCNDYSYCKKGYYVSLLAEARGFRPIPSVSALADLESLESIKMISEGFSHQLTKNLKDIKADTFELSVYFGKNVAEKYNSLARQLFNLFQIPLMKAFCIKKEGVWTIKSIKMIAFKEVPENHMDVLLQSIKDYFGKDRNLPKRTSKNWRYELSILFNINEKLPPSNEAAIRKFIDAAKELKMKAEVISSKDFALLNRFDGLFIRETTNVLGHTFKFSKKAELDGLEVIDDPQSILRCCNKVYLHDLLKTQGLAIPETKVIYKDTDLSVFKNYPLIIKKPDSAFSVDVKKVNSPTELKELAAFYFKRSDLLILQEFLKTDFDWRIGIIDNQPLYACKYFMAKGHWQIINHDTHRNKMGEAATVAIEEAPPKAIKLALQACKSIGSGLYGVDIKERDGKFYVIEVNDNPNIDKGYEDKVIGDRLYREIMMTFFKRLEQR